MKMARAERDNSAARSSRITKTWRWLRWPVFGLVGCAVFVGIWQGVATLFSLPAVEVPSVAATYDQVVSQHSILLTEAKTTLIESILGYVIAAAIAIPLGVLLARPGPLSRILNGSAVAAQIFPKITVAPLFIVWFGFGYTPKVLFVVLLSFFPITMNAAAGFSSIPIELRELARVIGMRPMRRLFHLAVPWALPQVFTGLKISASFAIIAAIVGEFVGSTGGLGVLIVRSQSNLNTALMFAAIVYATALGFAFYGAVVFLESLSIPWHVSRRHGRNSRG